MGPRYAAAAPVPVSRPAAATNTLLAMSEERDELRRADGKAAARRPRAVLWGAVLVLLAWFTLGGLGGQAQGQLSGVQSNDNATFLPENAESTLVSEAVVQFADSTEIPYLVVVEKEGGGALTPEDLATVQQFAESVPDLPLPEIGEDATLGDFLVGDTAPVAVPSEDGPSSPSSEPARKGRPTPRFSSTFSGFRAIRGILPADNRLPRNSPIY